MPSLWITLSIALLHVCLQNGVQGSISTKKGMAVANEVFRCGDLDAFQNLTWYWNWGNQFHPECAVAQPKPGDFVPMIWGFWGKVGRYGSKLTEGKILLGEIGDITADPYDTIFAFNEPNHADQSNLSPRMAAYAWIELQEKYPNKILVSPSASPPNTEKWFDEFFPICMELGCRIDYLATHSYSCDAAHDMKYLQGLYERYGLKIWFTEFACPNTRDPNVALNYMKEMLPMLEKADYIWKYSWFVHRWPFTGAIGSESTGWYLDKCNSLLEMDTSGPPVLTPLGRYYDEFQPN